MKSIRLSVLGLCSLVLLSGCGNLNNTAKGGIIGGALGGWLFELLNISWGGCLGQIGTAVIGAVIFLFVWKKLTR